MTIEVFARNKSGETRFTNFRYIRVLQIGEAIDCPWIICSASKIVSVAGRVFFKVSLW